MVTKMPTSFYQIAQPPAPAVGAEFTFKVPGGEFWRVIAVHYRFVASAAVANRLSHLIADDATDPFWRVATNQIVAAAGDNRYTGFAGAPLQAAVGSVVLFPLPTSGLLLPPGYRLRSATDAIDVGDQYSAIRAHVQVFPQGPVDEWLPTVDTQVKPMG
jgi:hypothetical protein